MKVLRIFSNSAKDKENKKNPYKYSERISTDLWGDHRIS